MCDFTRGENGELLVICRQTGPMFRPPEQRDKHAQKDGANGGAEKE